MTAGCASSRPALRCCAADPRCVLAVGKRLKPMLMRARPRCGSGDEKWIGGVRALNGKIIGIPYNAETVLEIDPVSRTAATFGVVSSSVKRKWVEGVLGKNGLVFAIPYDANAVLEIDPDTHALMLFGHLGSEPCKYYGGVRGPNDKIYGIPYSASYVLEIDPQRRTATEFAFAQVGWGKWSGGVLSGNGKIYAIPALARGILEIDVERGRTEVLGMLPGGNSLDDKWNGGVLAPNGRVYGIPWRSNKVLEFDPTTKAIALLGSLASTNFTWHGGVLTEAGRIVAVPYNSAWVLEIGESVCSGVKTSSQALLPQLASAPRSSDVPSATASPEAGAPATTAPTVPSVGLHAKQTFVLAMLGCPDASKTSENACFHLSHRLWHSVMITVLPHDAVLLDIRDRVVQSRLSHVPSNFCFLVNGHPLDPNVEVQVKATETAVASDSQQIILIDNEQCRIGTETRGTWLPSAAAAKGLFVSQQGLSRPAAVILGVSVVALFVAVACLYSARRSAEPHGGSSETEPILGGDNADGAEAGKATRIRARHWSTRAYKSPKQLAP